MNTYNYTSDYENYNDSFLNFQDIEVTDINSDGETEITSFVEVGGTEAMFVDINRDGTFDIAYADFDGDGEYDMDIMADISDLNIEADGFVVGQLIDDPIELIEFGLEEFLVDLIDDSQSEINEGVSINDFIDDDTLVVDFGSMFCESEDYISEYDEMDYDCDSCYDDMMF